MDTLVTPTAITPGIVSDSRSYDGPVWSSGAPADVAHFSVAAAERSANAVNSNLGQHFVRDAIERQAQANDLRAEIRAMANDYKSLYGYIGDLKATIESNEKGRLAADLQDAKFKLLLAEVKVATPV